MRAVAGVGEEFHTQSTGRGLELLLVEEDLRLNLHPCSPRQFPGEELPGLRVVSSLPPPHPGERWESG